MLKAGGSHTRKGREKRFPGESSVLKKHQECNSHDLPAVTSYNGEVSLPDTHLQTAVSIQDATHSPAATSLGTLLIVSTAGRMSSHLHTDIATGTRGKSLRYAFTLESIVKK